MIVPPRYTSWLEGLGFDEVSFGYSGMKLFSLAELEKGQVGYARAVDGRSFCDGQLGSWQPEWVVIGYETTCGDPIILDTSHKDLRVLTAMHGQGSWEPDPVARALDAFGDSLRIIRQIAVGREHPVALEKNPLPEEERDRALEGISRLNGEAGIDFWKIFLREPEG